MPTGGGKSLITQVLGYEKKGLSIVIVPTVSLAIDQERVARENIKVARENEIFCYYSGINNFNYNKINYFEEGNDTDEKWNINVLLLLNRKKQIQIVGLDLDGENRYIFTVKILNDQITQDTKETKALFERLRDEESAKSLNAFSILRKAVAKTRGLCGCSLSIGHLTNIPSLIIVIPLYAFFDLKLSKQMSFSEQLAHKVFRLRL